MRTNTSLLKEIKQLKPQSAYLLRHCARLVVATWVLCIATSASSKIRVCNEPDGKKITTLNFPSKTVLSPSFEKILRNKQTEFCGSLGVGYVPESQIGIIVRHKTAEGQLLSESYTVSCAKLSCLSTPLPPTIKGTLNFHTPTAPQFTNTALIRRAAISLQNESPYPLELIKVSVSGGGWSADAKAVGHWNQCSSEILTHPCHLILRQEASDAKPQSHANPGIADTSGRAVISFRIRGHSQVYKKLVNLRVVEQLQRLSLGSFLVF